MKFTLENAKSVHRIKCVKVRTLFAKNKVRFAPAEQLWLCECEPRWNGQTRRFDRLSLAQSKEKLISILKRRYTIKAKFHYAIWSQTGPKLVADLQRAGIWPVI